jgi:RNA polymerase sigma-70 factor (ECF subfamily)
MQEQEIQKLVGHLFRHESGRMAAVLTRIFGFHSIDEAEDIVQDTLLQAMSVWRYKGIPDNPSGWLITVAKRKAIDSLRQKKIHDQHHQQLSVSLKSEWTLSSTIHQLFSEDEIEDSQLRMIFACCHPAIPYESQIALTLKTLCGLSVSEIASAFLTNDETVSKRIYRAKEKIREQKIDLNSPPPVDSPGRLDAVLHTLYLLFNEGYNTSSSDQLIRHDLCEESMRLCLLLASNKIIKSSVAQALLALMCFQAARSDARTDVDGSIVLLKNQDRSKWNKKLIERGKYFLETASVGDVLSEYHLEAAIAALHADAPSFEKTEWSKILQLYDALSMVRPSPIVEMNKAIAEGYAISFEKGLASLRTIEGLNNYHLYHSAVGDFYSALRDYSMASKSYEKALQLSPSVLDKKLLETKLSSLTEKSL